MENRLAYFQIIQELPASTFDKRVEQILSEDRSTDTRREMEISKFLR